MAIRKDREEDVIYKRVQDQQHIIKRGAFV